MRVKFYCIILNWAYLTVTANVYIVFIK